jgi:hypothetical protein
MRWRWWRVGLQTHGHTQYHTQSQTAHSQPVQRRPWRGNQLDGLLLGMRAQPLQLRLPSAAARLVAQAEDFTEHVLKLWLDLPQDVEGKREKLRRRDLAYVRAVVGLVKDLAVWDRLTRAASAALMTKPSKIPSTYWI